MDAELRFHVEEYAEDLVRSGVPREEALRRARIEFGFTEAHTAQGNIGVKVWINNGEYSDSGESSDGANAQAGKVQKKSARPSKR